MCVCAHALFFFTFIWLFLILEVCYQANVMQYPNHLCLSLDLDSFQQTLAQRMIMMMMILLLRILILTVIVIIGMMGSSYKRVAGSLGGSP